MVERNPHFNRLPETYLFRKMQQIADTEVLNLSIGDTSLPIPEKIAKAMSHKALSLSTEEGYTGYGAGVGDLLLRELIAKHADVEPDEVFISDGAKSDIGRLQLLFGQNVSIAVQDPTYPVYAETGLLLGQKRVIPLPCTPANGFFPKLEKADLIYFCSPHNPTGYAASAEQLEELVHFAKKNQAIIIYDAAYSEFIQDASPRSIYEIPGSKEVAIEISSFSKSVGFTGVRLGWSIVPKQLLYRDQRRVHPDWLRIVTTFFNSASNIAQAGGIAAMQYERKNLIHYYLENASILRQALKNFPLIDQANAPYVWVFFGDKTFEDVLKETGVLAIPGSGFGKSGEGFLRFSAFGKRETIVKAAERLKDYEYLHPNRRLAASPT